MGSYTSADQGGTWKLSIATASLTSGTIYLVEPGNRTRSEVYIYLPDQGAQGLKVSLDAGEHFSATGTLPFGRILGLRTVPGAPGHLLAYGSEGMARSTDGGSHWQRVKGITGGIFGLATAGPHSSLYATGDAGVYASRDGGATFALANAAASYSSLSVSAAQPQVLYGKTGTGIYRSTDGGRTWSVLPPLKGNFAVLAVDPTDASVVYLSLSYPAAVYRLEQESKAWMSLTPRA